MVSEESDQKDWILDPTQGFTDVETRSRKTHFGRITDRRIFDGNTVKHERLVDETPFPEALSSEKLESKYEDKE